MKPVLGTWLAFVLCAQLGFAQTDAWERVKLIGKGKGVSVTLSTGKSVSGKMEEWKPDGLVLRKGKEKTVEVAKSDAAKVYLTAGISRGRRAAWAFGIGAGAVAGIGGAMMASDDGDYFTGSLAAFLIPTVGAGIGGIAAGIAALIPQHRELIYTAAPVAPATRR
jgi:hypothetical protein